MPLQYSRVLRKMRIGFGVGCRSFFVWRTKCCLLLYRQESLAKLQGGCASTLAAESSPEIIFFDIAFCVAVYWLCGLVYFA